MQESDWVAQLEAALADMRELQGATGVEFRSGYVGVAEALLRTAHAAMGQWDGLSRILCAAHLTLGQALGAEVYATSHFLVGSAMEMTEKALAWLCYTDD